MERGVTWGSGGSLFALSLSWARASGVDPRFAHVALGPVRRIAGAEERAVGCAG